MSLFNNKLFYQVWKCETVSWPCICINDITIAFSLHNCLKLNFVEQWHFIYVFILLVSNDKWIDVVYQWLLNRNVKDQYINYSSAIHCCELFNCCCHYCSCFLQITRLNQEKWNFFPKSNHHAIVNTNTLLSYRTLK